MKKLVLTLAAASALGIPGFALAGDDADCHFHGSKVAAQEVVATCAVKQRQTLIAGGKIDKSWQAIKPAMFDQVDGKRGKEWKVTFNNPDATDAAKRNLYMFFTAQGNFIAANHSGN